MIRAHHLTTLLALALGAGTTSPIHAQQVHGTVRDSITGRPISGAVVVSQDSAGRTLARTISNAGGTFGLAAARGTMRIHVVRLGFRPRDVTVPLPPDTPGTLAISMMPLPTLLEASHASTGATCRRRSDRDAAFALLEQARAALLATVVAREANPARLLRLKYARTFEGRSDRIALQEVHMESTTVATTSFSAVRSAVDFARLGFTAGAGMATHFLGVDADVLLDPRFADSYCFSIHARDPARENQIGLDFSAARAAPGRVDVDGTVWIDTAARRLRDIAYRYVGLGRRIEAEHPDGQTFFREMPNGVVLIDRWWLRAVLSVTDTVDGSEATHWQRQIRTQLAITQTGGELADARWPDGSTWHARLGALRVHGTNRSRELPNGTIVRLAHTDYWARVDSTGSFEIPNLVAGPYALWVVDPRLAPVGAEIPTRFRFVAEDDSTLAQSMRLPTASDFVADRCLTARQYDVAARIYLFGRLTTPAGAPVEDAVVSVLREVGPGDWQPIKTRMRTDAAGFFQFCEAELEEGETVMIRATFGAATIAEARRRLATDLNVIPMSVAPKP